MRAPALSVWVSCLLHNLDETVMNQITHPLVQEALQHLRELSADETLRWAALQREIALLDERTALNRARREGHEAGRTEGQAGLLERLLTRKFGSLPVDVVARIEQADAEQLQAWSFKLLDAPSCLDEVFGN
ncbi:DUF4351 domain-containing protein [Mesopusillimonas faecipullorum]|nr:DUF4351 domain-containing protein [Mesopusillimonas faecipullorum]